jgi:hypothetical protein
LADLPIAKNDKIDISTPLDTVVVSVIAAKNAPVEEEGEASEEAVAENK